MSDASRVVGTEDATPLEFWVAVAEDEHRGGTKPRRSGEGGQ